MPQRRALYERKELSEPIKLGASQMTVSPSFTIDFVSRSMTCCAPDVMIRSSKSLPTLYSFFINSPTVLRRGGYPSVKLYWRAATGSSLSILFDISAIACIGKASGAGLPAERDTTVGSAAYLNISLIADGLSVFTLSETIYSMMITSFTDRFPVHFSTFDQSVQLS